jgi:hypothetical protein
MQSLDLRYVACRMATYHPMSPRPVEKKGLRPSLIYCVPIREVRFLIIGYDVLTVVIMKSSVFCYITLCRKLSRWFLAWLILRP